VSALATIGARSAPLLALAPIVRAIVAHYHEHDAAEHVACEDAARALGVDVDALKLALRDAVRDHGLAALVGGQQAEIGALRAELTDLTTGIAVTSEEAASACADLSRAMRSVLPPRAR
jgi:hypothetical protein